MDLEQEDLSLPKKGKKKLKPKKLKLKDKMSAPLGMDDDGNLFKQS